MTPPSLVDAATVKAALDHTPAEIGKLDGLGGFLIGTFWHC
jgi:hypothetical protein